MGTAPSRNGTRRTAVAVLVVATLAACGSSGGSNPKSSSTTRRSTTTSSTSTTTSTTTAGGGTAVLAPPLLPLYPFQTDAEVAQWRGSGSRPEFSDAGKTAVAFARFLGYTDVNLVVTSTSDAKGEHVSVGSVVPDTDRRTVAAIVHLVRYDAQSGAPWVVVGTDDTDFALTAPAYGATITSPLPVGGRITGIDENIVVQVVQLHANGALGTSTGIPAGGQNSPWSGTMTFSTPSDPILMVAAKTGGHTRAVERFTVNGVRSAG